MLLKSLQRERQCLTKTPPEKIINNFKYSLVGRLTAGKTSIIKRYFSNKFIQNEVLTRGCQIVYKPITLKNGQLVKLCIWDTVGQQKFNSFSRLHYKDSHAIFIIYDITNQKSFKSATQFYYNEVNKEIDTKECLLILVANKYDLVQNAQQKDKEKIIDGSKKAQELGMLYYETSAKTGKNINQMFQEVASKLDLKKKQTTKVQNIKIKKSNLPKKNNNSQRGCGC